MFFSVVLQFHQQWSNLDMKHGGRHTGWPRGWGAAPGSAAVRWAEDIPIDVTKSSGTRDTNSRFFVCAKNSASSLSDTLLHSIIENAVKRCARQTMPAAASVKLPPEDIFSRLLLTWDA